MLWPRLLLLVPVAAHDYEPYDFEEATEKKKNKFPFLVELPDAEAFDEQVRRVAKADQSFSGNMDMSKRPPYAPLVLFHMPWCKHCQATLPELNKASANLEKAAKAGQFQHSWALPKLFTFSCEAPGGKAVCDEFCGTNFPTILLFRNQRTVLFNRPRTEQVLTWWIHRVSRHPVTMVQSMEHVNSYASHETTFILSLPQKDMQDNSKVEILSDIAIDYLDKFFFFITEENSEVGKKMGKAPSMTVRGPPQLELSPLPFKEEFSRESVQDWVTYNQFAAVIKITPWSFHDLRSTGYTVVVFAHARGKQAAKQRQMWADKVAELRSNGKYLFGVINASDSDSADLFKNYFPLLAPSVTSMPKIFAFHSTATSTMKYWEDPEFSSFGDLTLEKIDTFLATRENLQEPTTAHWFKEKRKLYIRYAGRDTTSMITAVALPLCILGICYMCVKTICGPDDEEESKSHKD